MKLKIKKETIISVFAVLSILLVTEMVIRMFWPHHRYIISPVNILASFPLAIKEGFFNHFFSTIGRTLCGFLIASILGVFLGVILGRIRWLRLILSPFIDFFRPLPSSAIIPAAMMIIGLNEMTYLFVIVFGGIWPILINTISGVKDVDATSKFAIEQLGLKKKKLLTLFILPEAAPEIFTGLKISLSICLILAVTAELIVGVQDGVGRFIKDVENGGNYSLMFFGILMVALLGFLLNTIFSYIEKNSPWLKHKFSEGEDYDE